LEPHPAEIEQYSRHGEWPLKPEVDGQQWLADEIHAVTDCGHQCEQEHDARAYAQSAPEPGERMDQEPVQNSRWQRDLDQQGGEIADLVKRADDVRQAVTLSSLPSLFMGRGRLDLEPGLRGDGQGRPHGFARWIGQVENRACVGGDESSGLERVQNASTDEAERQPGVDLTQWMKVLLPVGGLVAPGIDAEGPDIARLSQPLPNVDRRIEESIPLPRLETRAHQWLWVHCESTKPAVPIDSLFMETEDLEILARHDRTAAKVLGSFHPRLEKQSAEDCE